MRSREEVLKEALWALAQGVREEFQSHCGPIEENIGLPFAVEKRVLAAYDRIRELEARVPTGHTGSDAASPRGETPSSSRIGDAQAVAWWVRSESNNYISSVKPPDFMSGEVVVPLYAAPERPDQGRRSPEASVAAAVSDEMAKAANAAYHGCSVDDIEAMYDPHTWRLAQERFREAVTSALTASRGGG